MDPRLDIIDLANTLQQRLNLMEMAASSLEDERERAAIERGCQDVYAGVEEIIARVNDLIKSEG